MAPGGLIEVLGRAAATADGCGRDADDITVIAVSKTVGPDEILSAYATGQRDFGENRSNELASKAAELPDDVNWHFVGTLQSRKAKEVAPWATMIHSVDRPSLIDALARVESVPDLLLQINVAGEGRKHGASPSEAPSLIERGTAAGLRFVGLMLIPPLVEDPEQNRKWFAELREMRDRLSRDWPELRELSMGMTDDFEVAIEEGATLIRVGRAIFGG